MSAAPLGSENANVKIWAEPLPELGVTETGTGGPPPEPVTLSEALVLWISVWSVPATVTVLFPLAAPEPAVTVKVLEPEPVTVLGLKLPVTPAGSPDTAKLTVPLNPLLPVCVTV
jgi:hypothetical protein